MIIGLPAHLAPRWFHSRRLGIRRRGRTRGGASAAPRCCELVRRVSIASASSEKLPSLREVCDKTARLTGLAQTYGGAVTARAHRVRRYRHRGIELGQDHEIAEADLSGLRVLREQIRDVPAQHARAAELAWTTRGAHSHFSSPQSRLYKASRQAEEMAVRNGSTALV